LVGGALAQNHQWRWIFYLNLPIVGIGFVGVAFFLNQDLRQRELVDKLSEIDYLGSFIFVASTTSALIALSWGGTMFSWTSWHTLVVCRFRLPELSSHLGIIKF
jgi:MFS family permease